MNARFLRDEAARFRGMAEEADREATRERFLAMAADYEARAKVADGLMKPGQNKPVSQVPEAKQDELVQSNGHMAIAGEQNETVAPERRPVGRPRLGLTAKKMVPFENQ